MSNNLQACISILESGEKRITVTKSVDIIIFKQLILTNKSLKKTVQFFSYRGIAPLGFTENGSAVLLFKASKYF